jgi:hypothetical protein
MVFQPPQDDVAALAAARGLLPSMEGEILEALLFASYFDRRAKPPEPNQPSPI